MLLAPSPKKDILSRVNNILTFPVRAIDDPSKFMAYRLRDAMKGVGTKEKILVRVVTWRAEIDMGDIKQAFEEKFGKKLEDEIDVSVN